MKRKPPPALVHTPLELLIMRELVETMRTIVRLEQERNKLLARLKRVQNPK